MVATVGRCYTNPQDYAQENYYSQGEALTHSEWQGKAAAVQGLSGTIKEQEFHNAYQALDPQGHPLRRQQNYQKPSQRHNRPGTDITLSAPKSLSVAALVLGDQTVLEAHQSAVRATMEYVEKHCLFYQTKQQGKKLLLPSQTAQIAIFHHDDNRNKDPQLHSHCVVLNQTQCPDGKWRAVANRQIYQQVKTIGAYYAHELARQLQKKGRLVTWTDDHTLELAGVEKEKLDAIFSTRSQQIEAELAQQGLTRKTATAQQKQAICLKTRAEKKQHHRPEDREKQLAEWQRRAREAGLSIERQKLEGIYQKPSQERPGGEEQEEQGEQGKRESGLSEQSGNLSSPTEQVRRATEILSERKTAFHKHELLKECLRQSQGQDDPQKIQQEIEQNRDLVPTKDGRLTSQQQLSRERQILQQAQRGQNSRYPLASREQAQTISLARGLNPGQTSALMHLATSQDAVMLVQGNAGVGKTYTMKAFKELIKQQTPTSSLPSIRGLAPSAAAADVLQSESGISSQTLASYLLTANERLPRKQILLVDEAGMLSAQQMQQLLEKAEATESRIILIGDTKQLSAVEAGAPFKLLQERGLPTALIDENLRQRDPHLKQVVDLMATHDHHQGSVNQAYEQLKQQGKIQEIRDEPQRRQAIASDYLNRPIQAREKTLILAGTNADQQTLTESIRQGLIKEGALGRKSLQITILRRKDLDKFALTQCHHYQRGDVIKFPTESAQFSRDGYYRVTAVNSESNSVSLIDTVGGEYTLPLERYKKRQIYQVQQREIRAGEKMRFTQNIRHPDQKQINGQWFSIEGWTENNQISLITKGQTQNVTPEQLLHSDYRYVDTVHSSQGRTADYCIYAAPAAPSLTLGRESFYVAASRAREEFVIYSASAADLGVNLEKSRANENALDLVSGASKELREKPKVSRPSDNQTNPSLALTEAETETEKEPVNGREREESQAISDGGERLAGITESLTSSSRRAAELAEQLRGTSREAEANRRDVKETGVKATKGEKGKSGNKRKTRESRNSDSELNRPAADRTREYQQLEERARGSSRAPRKARKSAKEKLGEVAAQLKQGIKEFSELFTRNRENIEELPIWGTGMDGQGDISQTPRIAQEYLGNPPGYQSGDLGIQPPVSAQPGNAQPYQWSGEQFGDTAETAGTLDGLDSRTAAEWYEDLSGKARQDRQPEEYGSTEELDLKVATYGIMLQLSPGEIVEILKESGRLASLKESQRTELISAREAQKQMATYPEEIYQLAWGLWQKQPEAEKEYRRLQQRPAVMETVRKLLQYGTEESQEGALTREGQNYVLIGSRDFERLGIIAKDGRGLILSRFDGVMEGKLSESDVEIFGELGQKVAEILAKNQGSASWERQITREEEQEEEWER